MNISRSHWIGIGLAAILLVLAFALYGTKVFFLLVGLGFLVALAPFVFTIMHENKVSYEKEEMFLEFSRNLVESVKTGTPISKSIVNVRGKAYGELSHHVQKLANQITMGIPLSVALEVFSKDINNKMVSRAITLIGQAEKAGGEIGEILEAVAGAVNMSDKLKKERKASISTLVVQGYIIFFVFLVIILVMQFQILPMVSGVGDIGGDLGIAGISSVSSTGGVSQEEMSSAFLYMLLIQGFFTGLTVGKLSEGNVKTGIKHSFALMLIAFLMSTGANIIMGG
jgi:flagellar protein FlaJ